MATNTINLLLTLYKILINYVICSKVNGVTVVNDSVRVYKRDSNKVLLL
jgi:hypothetical protein